MAQRMIARSTTRNNLFIKHHVSDGEYQLYGALRNISRKYNNSFHTLYIPHALERNKGESTLVLPRYCGKTFNGLWDESNGGVPMGLDLAQEIPLLIKDLSKIDINMVRTNRGLMKMEHAHFDYFRSKLRYRYIAKVLLQQNLICASEYVHIKSIMDYKQTTPQIFNNGDFYPRNLIKLHNHRIVLIDWEVWNDHSPFFVIDHPENVAAVMYVHMWGNSRWQQHFLNQLNKEFDITKASWQKAVTMKSLELAHFWISKNSAPMNLVEEQLKLLREQLNS